MLELTKRDNTIFAEYYEGTAISGARVICILDDNCVRYSVYDRNSKRITRREYANNNKTLAIRKATEWLNKI
jgi:hypothetical protein